jgi:hypothetical protein
VCQLPRSWHASCLRGAPGEPAADRDLSGCLPLSAGWICGVHSPHEEAQLREGQVKPAEGGTGALALRAASLCGGSALATYGPQAGDPNWDDPHPLATHALSLAQDGVLVDIHQMRPRGFDLCLG